MKTEFDIETMKELKDWLRKELEMQKQTVVFGSNKIYLEGITAQTKNILKKISELEATITVCKIDKHDFEGVNNGFIMRCKICGLETM